MILAKEMNVSASIQATNQFNNEMTELEENSFCNAIKQIKVLYCVRCLNGYRCYVDFYPCAAK